MKRFLLLYTNHQRQNHYAEGLIHSDGAVYVRGFSSSDGGLFYSMLDMRNTMRDDEEIKQYQILELDKENT